MDKTDGANRKKKKSLLSRQGSLRDIKKNLPSLPFHKSRRRYIKTGERGKSKSIFYPLGTRSLDRRPTECCGQFHQHFKRNFFVRMSFRQFFLLTCDLEKSCRKDVRTKKFSSKMLMKLTPGFEREREGGEGNRTGCL